MMLQEVDDFPVCIVVNTCAPCHAAPLEAALIGIAQPNANNMSRTFGVRPPSLRAPSIPSKRRAKVHAALPFSSVSFNQRL